MADNTKLKAPDTTPGHWFIDPASGNTIRTARRGCIAVVCSAPPYVDGDILAMRAAPQLLAALLEALRVIEKDRAIWYETNSSDGLMSPMDGRVLVVYDTAIRHAREALLQAGCRS